ncbi:MAG: Xaa-Pro peptidase family protein [Candidatus Lokiarchaeota archaeon]|nr:Xaa-Pro peptidase family protein [Candidatus Harpocratesius repetitus]
MRSITNEKFEKLLKFMQDEKIDVLMIADNESSKNVNLQYLSGHPMDALFIVTSSGENALIPWDVPLAQKEAQVDEIIDPINYKYNYIQAVKEYLEKHLNKSKVVMAVTDNFPYSGVIRYEESIPNISFYREIPKISQFISDLRSTKSHKEIEILRKAAQIGTETIQDIKHFLKNAVDESENDLAFYVHKKMADKGAEDLAFPTLVGNANRAHMIHCHPWASSQKLAVPGLGLIDFGAKYKGYHSDITVPFSFGELNETQQKMHELTFKAYQAAIDMLEIGVPLWKVNQAAIDVIKAGGFDMPHSLGHGLGLTVHDSPFISRKPSSEYALKYWKEVKLEEGMVFTIEPGIYKEGFGGQRLENDVAIVNGKVEILTKSEFIQI